MPSTVELSLIALVNIFLETRPLYYRAFLNLFIYYQFWVGVKYNMITAVHTPIPGNGDYCVLRIIIIWYQIKFDINCFNLFLDYQTIIFIMQFTRSINNIKVKLHISLWGCQRTICLFSRLWPTRSID